MRAGNRLQFGQQQPPASGSDATTIEGGVYNSYHRYSETGVKSVDRFRKMGHKNFRDDEWASTRSELTAAGAIGMTSSALWSIASSLENELKGNLHSFSNGLLQGSNDA
jgi:hypothetical protein